MKRIPWRNISRASALYTNNDREKDKETVSMMTVHTAKGLEFSYVFVCGMNEGIFQSKHVDTEERLEEERRMAYVAFTRAEKALYISDAEGLNYDESFPVSIQIHLQYRP